MAASSKRSTTAIKNFTIAKEGKRMEQIDASISRYLATLDRADREDSDVTEAEVGRIKEKIAGLRHQMQFLKDMERQVEAAPDQQVWLTDPDARSMAPSGRGTGIVVTGVAATYCGLELDCDRRRRWTHCRPRFRTLMLRTSVR
jgi:BMFP domain-containing protein YqiC